MEAREADRGDTGRGCSHKPATGNRIVGSWYAARAMDQAAEARGQGLKQGVSGRAAGEWRLARPAGGSCVCSIAGCAELAAYGSAVTDQQAASDGAGERGEEDQGEYQTHRSANHASNNAADQAGYAPPNGAVRDPPRASRCPFFE